MGACMRKRMKRMNQARVGWLVRAWAHVDDLLASASLHMQQRVGAAHGTHHDADMCAEVPERSAARTAPVDEATGQGIQGGYKRR